MKRCVVFLLMMVFVQLNLKAQTAEELILKVKAKLDKVNDYEAKGKMKMNITFIKAPIATIKVYYKKPDQLRINNEKGISLIPKGSVNINIGAILSDAGSYDIIDAGKEDKTNFRIVRLLPKDENSNVVLSTFYIDAEQGLVRKAKTTTRDNGSYELEMAYGKYAEFGLPDKVVFSFNTKDYKLPKGVTFDYDDGSKKVTDKDKTKNRKGRVEIVYSAFVINKGIPDSIFSQGSSKR
ncbi:MAG: hypothetical protein H7Y42_10210 [Chitinophagaceae bacterium]|nr:hypothetical protein [Chitinophagaceae bacterium]